MSIPPDSPGRGCGSNFSPPVSAQDRRGAESLAQTVRRFNCQESDCPLHDIVYRSSDGEGDILNHVFRWDTTPFETVFRDGFRARRQQAEDRVYYNLEAYVHGVGRPLQSTRPTSYAFISTTLDSSWEPTATPAQVGTSVYRYEIYAPGGISVAPTLGDRYQYPGQDEVAFVAGIAPQYIRAAQRFRLVRRSWRVVPERADDVIILSTNFNPEPSRLLDIRRPVYYRYDKDPQHGKKKLKPLRIRIYNPLPHDREERVTFADRATVGRWYDAGDVADTETDIDAAAFRPTYQNQAYLFTKDHVLLKNHDAAANHEVVVNGRPYPIIICAEYPSLAGTAFGERGIIDSAFGSRDGNQAFIFRGNLCALVDYAGKILLQGPKTVTAMFPFFKGTVFETGVDSALEATTPYEAHYLFRGNRHALTNYGSGPHLIAIRPISGGFATLKNTSPESGVDAASASHTTDEEAYLSKGDSSYVLINVAPGTTDDYIAGGLKQILPNWPSLRCICLAQTAVLMFLITLYLLLSVTKMNF